ncbi:unnamed protein product [Leptidea sinapis]|uniref:Carboxylic ester hydrolase n=1 Tax=Leptidea sinapis TaxID=189913 RepID=A0A5E4R4L7_9NEOP|nr:unnamed protein product [Leptidea sinapis]
MYMLLFLVEAAVAWPLVRIDQGWVRGVNDVGISKFRGIPYAVADPDNVFGALNDPALGLESAIAMFDSDDRNGATFMICIKIPSLLSRSNVPRQACVILSAVFDCKFEVSYCEMWMLLFLVEAAVAWPLVRIDQGWVRGVYDEGISKFMGIPYAAVDPANVFGPAVPNPKFHGIFIANNDSAICPQIEEFNNTYVGDLNCLHMNVYVPSNPLSKKLPVLVAIYGGSFSIGFAGRYMYGPKYLTQHEVILVTFNYRLGPYGFMCLDTPEMPGNQGMKDQVLALRWVQNNIEFFGGDKDTVTVIGNSAGAISIELHLLSNQEKLFHRAILQSGSVLISGLFQNSNRNVPLVLAQELGFPTDSIESALSFLSLVDPKILIETNSKLGLHHTICIEKEFPGVENIISKQLDYNNDKVKSIDIISGYNNQEVLIYFIYLSADDYKYLNLFEEVMATFQIEDVDEIAHIMRRFYIGDEEMNIALRNELIDFISDYGFVYPIQRSLDLIIKNSNAKIYEYMFSYSGGRNFVKSRLNITEGGATHADELGYLYEMEFFDSNLSDADDLIMGRMTKMWTNFAKYGVPIPETSDLLPLEWLPATRDQINYIEIDTVMKNGTALNHKRKAIWDMLYTFLDLNKYF